MGTTSARPVDDTLDRDETYSELLAELWESFKGLTLKRLEAVEDASTSFNVGTLGDEQRKEAQSAAHMLAGAVGTYGYTAGSALAKQAEDLLRTCLLPGGGHEEELSAIVGLLRRELEGPQSVAASGSH